MIIPPGTYRLEEMYFSAVANANTNLLHAAADQRQSFEKLNISLCPKVVDGAVA